MGTHPIFESDFDCLTVNNIRMSLIGRILVQNCVTARLQLNFDQIEANTETEPIFAEIESGLIVYVCFRAEADETTVAKMAKILLEGLCSILSSKKLQKLNLSNLSL